MKKENLEKELKEALYLLRRSMAASIFAGDQNKYYPRLDRFLKKHEKVRTSQH